MDKFIERLQRQKEMFISILKLAVAAFAAFGAGYILRCGVELANSSPLEITTEAPYRRITTVDSLWTCPVHPDCPLSKLNSCPKCRAGWGPLYPSSNRMASEQVLPRKVETSPVESGNVKGSELQTNNECDDRCNQKEFLARYQETRREPELSSH